MDNVVRDCGTKIIKTLSGCSCAKVFQPLCEQLEQDFKIKTPGLATELLVQFKEFLEQSQATLRRTCKKSDRPELLESCVAVVADLLMLGASQIISQHDVLADLHQPAEVKTLATQLFAVACSQQRRVKIRFDPLQFERQVEIPLERALDQGTVTAGILDDDHKDVLAQLWDMIPQFKNLTRAAPEFSPDDIKKMATALRLMHSGKNSRVTIAIKGSCTESSGARSLRWYLASRNLDVDVLIRTGKSRQDIEELERGLIMASWFCLKQIEELQP
jgi:hypothetical protein